MQTRASRPKSSKKKVKVLSILTRTYHTYLPPPLPLHTYHSVFYSKYLYLYIITPHADTRISAKNLQAARRGIVPY